MGPAVHGKPPGTPVIQDQVLATLDGRRALAGNAGGPGAEDGPQPSVRRYHRRSVSHEDTDDFFLVLSGRMTIQLRDRDIELGAGELFVVPRGVEHCPKADEEAHVLLIEPRGTVNTGEAGGGMTVEEMEI